MDRYHKPSRLHPPNHRRHRQCLDEISCGTDPLLSSSVPTDTDGDRTCNNQDTDDDGDGWTDTAETACGSDPLNSSSVPTDTDGDNTCDSQDTDDDGDGWADTTETACGTDPLNSSSVPTDTDGDNTCDSQDTDDDNDGSTDTEEIACGSNPLINSSVPTDTDSDTVCDGRDIDDDNDGLIEIRSLADLHNIRYNLSGTSYDDESNDTGSAFAACETDSNWGSICGAPATLPTNCTGRSTTTNLCGYELMATLDFNPGCTVNNNSTPSYVGDDYCAANPQSPYYNAGQGWLPIGGVNGFANFAAIFEGNRSLGYEIRNLYINRVESSSAFYFGLFGRVNPSAVFRNVALVQLNISITDRDSINSYTGGLVGYSSSSGTLTITNSYATGRLSGVRYIGGLLGFINANFSITDSYTTTSISGDSYLGGLIGEINNRGTITVSNCHTTGSVSGSLYVGGLIGYNTNTSNVTFTLRDSYTTGSVSGSWYVGGLIGYNASSSSGTRHTITNNYTTGSISGGGSGRHVGGLIGTNQSQASGNIVSITNNYATGSISGSSDVGGLIGSNSSLSNGTTNITNSYAAGSVSASQYAGGLVGYHSVFLGSGGITVTNSYWDTNTTGQSSSANAPASSASNYNRYRGLSTAQMQSATSGAIIRNMGSAYTYTAGQYPRLP